MSFRPLTSFVAAMLLAGCSMPGIPGAGSSQPGAEAVRSGEPARPEAAAAAADPAAIVPIAIQSDYDRAVLLLETGDQAGAESEFLRFSAAHPGYAAPWVNLAIIQIAQGRHDEARASIDSALAIDADYAPAWNQLGILHRKSGNFSEAEAAYLNAVTVNPGYALAHLNLGILNDLYLGQLESALSAYQAYQALQTDEDPQVARWIADLSRRTGQ